MIPLMMVAAALALPATFVAAQQDDFRSDLYLHRLQTTPVHIESVAPRAAGDGATPQLPSLDAYNFEYSPSDLISLRRNYVRSVVDRPSAVLGTGLQESDTTEAALHLGSQTAFRFSTSTTQVRDIRGVALDSKTSQVMGFNQAFGQGESASALSLTRTVTTRTPYLGATTTSTVQALQFHSGLSKSSDLLLKATQSESDAKGSPRELDLHGVLKLTFSGGEAPFSYLRNQKQTATTDVLTEKMDAVIPIAMNGRTAIAEYHSAFTTTNGLEKGTRTIHLGLPLRLFGQNASFDHLIAGKNEGAGMAETTTTRLTAPFKLAGGLFTTEGVYLSLRQPGVSSETLRTKLMAPLAGGIATIQHQTVTTETAGGGLVEQEQLAMVLPNIKIGDRVAFAGQYVSTDTVGVMDVDVTNVSVTAQPLKPWQIAARCQINDVGPLPTTTSTQVHSRLSLNDKTALEGRLSEAQIVGTSPNILRLIEFVRDRGDSGFSLRAGVASYGAAGVQTGNAHRMEITAGRASSVALTASYSEYNPSTFARYGTDPTVAVSLQHGDPSHFAERLRYEDQATRVEPLSAVEVALKALGATVQMSYQAHPLGPDGKTVRNADQYDASIGRKLFGDLNLHLGYRHVDYDGTTDMTSEHFRIQLDGGSEARGGKLAVAFLSGDFCPRGSSPTVLAPGSMLDITYARSWGSNGRLSLIVKRHTAASPSLGDDTTEGRVEFSTAF